MTIDAISGAVASPMLTSIIYPGRSVTPAAANSAPPSPAVINNVASAGNQFGSSAADIQGAVDGINGLIQSYNNTDWSKLKGMTPEQISIGKEHTAKIFQGAEGATVALAGERGVTGVTFNFKNIGTGAAAPSGVTSPTAAAQANPVAQIQASVSTPASSSATISETSANSSADNALAILTALSKPPMPSSSSSHDTLQKQYFYI